MVCTRTRAGLRLLGAYPSPSFTRRPPGDRIVNKPTFTQAAPGATGCYKNSRGTHTLKSGRVPAFIHRKGSWGH